jgi:hypothetical protein
MPADADTPEPQRSRDLRDRPVGRIAILVAVLAVALVASRSCAGGEEKVTKEDAVATARAAAVFEPDDLQVRFLRKGLPSRPYWIVSMYQGTFREPTRVQVVTVDAITGEIADDGLP